MEGRRKGGNVEGRRKGGKEERRKGGRKEKKEKRRKGGRDLLLIFWFCNLAPSEALKKRRKWKKG